MMETCYSELFKLLEKTGLEKPAKQVDWQLSQLRR